MQKFKFTLAGRKDVDHVATNPKGAATEVGFDALLLGVE